MRRCGAHAGYVFRPARRRYHVITSYSIHYTKLYDMPEENDVLPSSLGIPIIREIMDDIRYEVQDGKNCLIMTKKLK